MKSVRVLPGGEIILSIYAPEARDVTIGGELVPWGQKVEGVKSDNGVWTFTIPNVKTGTYRYNFVVDGVKVYDPKAPNAFETSALVDVTPDGEKEFFALRKNVPHGAMAELYYYSTTTKSMRRMHIWTPPGYNAKNIKLPVFYLIHGGGDSDAAWPNVGRAGFIMDNLLSEGKCKEMIVVMPDGGMDTKLFVKDFVNDIIPLIQSDYNVYTDADHRALAGLSMGGLEVTESFMAHPDMFAYINVMSSGWFSNNKEMYESGDKRLAEIAPTLNKTVKYLIFTQGGPEDIAYNNGKEMLKVFDKNGIKYEFSEMPGGHSWIVWRQDLRNFASKIFR
ncbi:MAG TPA: alpha/beta hydrolase-fold protein [Bacteroidales bacterium]|nr:alpha/beta hydrolase-fold protein [Bacteroidales bacterium]